MKPRHAAALALVGWYLMQPPLVTPNSFNFDAPLSRWDIEESFDTASDCEQTWNSMTEKAKGKSDVLSRREQFGHCIATDDPRLKGK